MSSVPSPAVKRVATKKKTPPRPQPRSTSSTKLLELPAWDDASSIYFRFVKDKKEGHEHAWLSNLHRCPPFAVEVQTSGRGDGSSSSSSSNSKRTAEFESSEQYFQWSKMVYAGNVAHAEAILAQPEPSKCKWMGGKRCSGKASAMSASALAGWEDVKLDAMERAMAGKFRDPELREKLLATGSRPLVEHLSGPFGDPCWGVKRA